MWNIKSPPFKYSITKNRWLWKLNEKKLWFFYWYCTMRAKFVASRADAAGKTRENRPIAIGTLAIAICSNAKRDNILLWQEAHQFSIRVPRYDVTSYIELFCFIWLLSYFIVYIQGATNSRRWRSLTRNAWIDLAEELAWKSRPIEGKI